MGDNTKDWCAIKVGDGSQLSVANKLIKRGHFVLAPSWGVRKADSRVRLDRQVFPGYLFANQADGGAFGFDGIDKFPGAIGVLRYGPKTGQQAAEIVRFREDTILALEVLQGRLYRSPDDRHVLEIELDAKDGCGFALPPLTDGMLLFAALVRPILRLDRHARMASFADAFASNHLKTFKNSG